ncbi:MAG TPA: iron chelate uptake ABC transporter family permease subunit [Cytophagaceae bacterium]|jgi:manganese/zinc/iron transport system permease protein|nr:iron chelate uptake ABC transporter family permease subunit [Cytophagaceae bacterium]
MSDYQLLYNPNVLYVILGCLLMSVSASTVGTFTFLRKKSLIGDAVAHAILPGICLAFLLNGTKNPLYLIPGAFLTGWLSILIVDFITHHSKIKQDAAISIVLSVFFGTGIWLLTVIQHSGMDNQSGLDAFLFGKAAALTSFDVWVFGLVALLLIVAIWAFYKEFQLLSFDKDFAQSIGYKIQLLELLLSGLTVLAIVTGIQAVGVVLMASLLIAPAATARFWSDKLHVMIFIAILISSVSAIVGASVSYVAPQMPTGPWIVMVLSFSAILTFVFAPQKGIVIKWIKQRHNQKLMLKENILKTFYYLTQTSVDHEKTYFTLADIEKQRSLRKSELNYGIEALIDEGYIEIEHEQYYRLTKEGLQQGKRVAHLHRLWELYLTEYLRIAPDHVHDDAETIEHVLTPELQDRLEIILGNPEIKPEVK